MNINYEYLNYMIEMKIIQVIIWISSFAEIFCTF